MSRKADKYNATFFILVVPFPGISALRHYAIYIIDF